MPHKDRAARRAYEREWKRKNAERHRYAIKVSDAAMHANARARKFGVPGVLTAIDVREVFEQQPTCFYCGSSERLGIDHVVPMSEGGPNVPENLTTACHSCNGRKRTGRRPGVWASKFDQCQACETTERPHVAHGLCKRCLLRSKRAERAS